jgi:hypothetical protein
MIVARTTLPREEDRGTDVGGEWAERREGGATCSRNYWTDRWRTR